MTGKPTMEIAWDDVPQWVRDMLKATLPDARQRTLADDWGAPPRFARGTYVAPTEVAPGFWRRTWPNKERCGCPSGTDDGCGNKADGEDRLCSDCRANHRPDQTFVPPYAPPGDEA